MVMYVDTLNFQTWWCANSAWKMNLSATPGNSFALTGATQAAGAVATPTPGNVTEFFDSALNVPAAKDSNGNESQMVPVTTLAALTALVTVGTPVASPGAGTYSSSQSVTLTAANSTVIYYSLSTTPTCGTGTLYSGAIAITTTSTLQAIGCASQWLPSAVLSAAYTISAGTVGTPAASPGAGTYTSSQSVTLTAANSTSIYYSLTTTPTCGTGTLYSGAIAITATSTLQAIGCASGWTPSAVLSAAYTISGAGFSLISVNLAYGQSAFTSPVYPYGGTVAVNNAGAKVVVVVFSTNAHTGSTFTVTSSLGNTCSLPLAVQTATATANTGETIGIATCAATYSGTDSIVAQDTAHLVTSGVAIVALPYSDAGSAAADPSNSNLITGVGTSYGTNPVNTGSITPTVNGEVIVTGFDAASSGTTVDSGMTIVESLASNYGGTGANTELSVGALIQTSAAAINPAWGTDHIYHAPVAAIVSVKP